MEAPSSKLRKFAIRGIFESPKEFLKTRFLYISDSELLGKLPEISQNLAPGFSFAIMIPMYNEQDNAFRCISTQDHFLKQLPHTTKIIAVDDASKDDTLNILLQLKKSTPRLSVLRHEKNQGYGGANVTGAKKALEDGIDYILFMDADLTQDVRYIPAFLPYMEQGVEFIKATRYSGGGGVTGVPLRRWVVSYVGNLVAKRILNTKLTDYTNGFRAIKSELFRGIEFEERGFPYLIEEIVKLRPKAKTFANVPYVLSVRQGGVSKFIYSYRTYFNYLRWLFK